jgi:hypothetical protein
MKLISIEVGRTTWLFPVEEIMPLAGTDGKKIIAAITDGYGFSHPPGNPTAEEIEKNGLKFAGGHFRFNNELMNVGEFIVFNDGIVAQATTTEGAAAFLDDIYNFLRAEFHFREIVSEVKTINLSSVVVEFEISISVALNKYKRIFDLVSGQLNLAEKTQYPAELTRMDFVLNMDPEFRPQNPPRLMIEKRANTPFKQHRYFSSGPLTTKQHLAVLEKIELELSDRLISRNAGDKADRRV